VVRAIGPTLSSFGLTTALPGAKLDVFCPPMSTTTPQYSNNQWGGAPSLSAAFLNVGAFALPPDSHDAALQTRLGQNLYTARLTATDPTTAGVALAEIYDSAPLATHTRLINVSARGYTGPGEQILIVGFVIAGNAPKRVLIRGVGPGLIPQGVKGTLANPKIHLVSFATSATVAENDDWGGGGELKAAFAQIGAFTLADDSKDAALVLTLPPGIYTVDASGVGDTTGEVLVEVYDLDP
jgi:hypothetical protein